MWLYNGSRMRLKIERKATCLFCQVLDSSWQASVPANDDANYYSFNNSHRRIIDLLVTDKSRYCVIT